MKKLAKLFGFALVAMVLFAGCGKKDKWKDVDQDVTELEFSDGTWVGEAYSYSYAEEDGFKVEEEEDSIIKFTVAGDKYTITAGSQEKSTTYPKEAPTEAIEQMGAIMKAFGQNVEVDGRTISIKTVFDDSDLANYKDKNKAYFLAIVDNFVGLPEDNKFKTNEDKTKYRFYAEDEETGEELEITFVKQ